MMVGLFDKIIKYNNERFLKNKLRLKKGDIVIGLGLHPKKYDLMIIKEINSSVILGHTIFCINLDNHQSMRNADNLKKVWFPKLLLWKQTKKLKKLQVIHAL